MNPFFYADLFGNVNIFSYISSMKITKDILIAIEKKSARKEMKDAGSLTAGLGLKDIKTKRKKQTKNIVEKRSNYERILE